MRRRRRLTSVSTLRTVTNVSPRQILREQRFPAEDNARVGRQQMQQPELLVGEVDVAPAGAHLPASRHVDLDAADGQDGVRLLGGRRRGRAP